MSGHSKWSSIKHKKESTDKKRGALFSKLLKAIAVAAREVPDPESNPRLRAAIEKAKANNVPLANIERAVKKSSEAKDLFEVTIEAYGPQGSAFVIDCVTDNKNRTLTEVKQILIKNNAKFAESGSVLWNFEPLSSDGGRKAKFIQEITEGDSKKVKSLIEVLEDHADVQRIHTNTNITT